MSNLSAKVSKLEERAEKVEPCVEWIAHLEEAANTLDDYSISHGERIEELERRMAQQEENHTTWVQRIEEEANELVAQNNAAQTDILAKIGKINETMMRHEEKIAALTAENLRLKEELNNCNHKITKANLLAHQLREELDEYLTQTASQRDVTSATQRNIPIPSIEVAIKDEPQEQRRVTFATDNTQSSTTPTKGLRKKRPATPHCSVTWSTGQDEETTEGEETTAKRQRIDI